jgi:DNA-binding FrmR family transcriptional regulator
MIDGDRDCADILQELCVVRAELRSAIPMIMCLCLSKCRPLPAMASEYSNERLEKLIAVVSRFADD